MTQNFDLTLRIPHTYAWTGAVVATSGSTNYFPPFVVPQLPGQRLLLAGIWVVLRNGSCNVSILQNNSGSGLSDLTNVSVTTSLTNYMLTTFQEIADGDIFQPSVSSPSGSPDGLTVTFLIDYIMNVDVQ